MERIRMTEYVDLDLDREMWVCNRCDRDLISAHESYKRGCLLYNRNPQEVHRPHMDAPYNFSPDPEWVRIVEFYCPGCGTQLDTEYLPPGHPITHDIEIEISRLKSRLAAGELVINAGKLSVPVAEREA